MCHDTGVPANVLIVLFSRFSPVVSASVHFKLRCWSFCNAGLHSTKWMCNDSVKFLNFDAPCKIKLLLNKPIRKFKCYPHYPLIQWTQKQYLSMQIDNTCCIIHVKDQLWEFLALDPAQPGSLCLAVPFAPTDTWPKHQPSKFTLARPKNQFSVITRIHHRKQSNICL